MCYKSFNDILSEGCIPAKLQTDAGTEFNSYWLSMKSSIFHQTKLRLAWWSVLTEPSRLECGGIYRLTKTGKLSVCGSHLSFKNQTKKKKRLKKDTELCALTRCGISLTNRHIGYPGHVKTPDVAMVQLCHGDIKAARTKDVTIFIGAITTAHARWISWIGVCCIVMLTVLSLCSWGSGYLP